MLAAPDNHYQCLNFEEIKAIRPPAAPDCVLFLWATVPMLALAIDLMRAWDFTYKSQCVWIKLNADGSRHKGNGYWFRNSHELLLVGTRGKPPAPAMGTQPEPIVDAWVGRRHSEKPAIIRQMIERVFPTLPKFEMFARGKAPKGWTFWGNEAA
jgi:N6-adenosine-specific RNA methylase IME4